MRTLFAATLCLAGVNAQAQSVTTYHNGINRHGEYVVPGLTAATASSMHLDTAFNATFNGAVYAQPLFWQKAGELGRVILATETNQVEAVSASTGRRLWSTQLPASAPGSALQCGNINPEGITGTPAIDPASGTIYLDAVTGTTSATVRHRIYALSAQTGSVLPGYPLDIQSALAAKGVGFDSTDQGERGALLFFGGALYVTYGGRSGDCGSYHGTVVQIAPSTHPSVAGVWATRAVHGGIWAQGGIASDGTSVFVTTGNTAGTTDWADGEAILRLHPGLAHSASNIDFYTPANWHALDDSDADLGGTEAIPFAAPGVGNPRVIAFGKDGNAYLLDRHDLGGIGGALAVRKVSNSEIITAAALYNTASASMVVFRNGADPACGSSLTMLDITVGANPLRKLWCQGLNGAGAPIITTSNGAADPLVWVIGAEGDNRLHGFDALTGRPVFSGGTLQGLRHFETILAASNHLYVAGNGVLYGFTFTR